ncbi:hypothetical protein TNCV_447151 [Trichonephila clavipes]|nr:hypothetical protein TNCV_447151 [Trichonephila clavipes]
MDSSGIRSNLLRVALAMAAGCVRVGGLLQSRSDAVSALDAFGIAGTKSGTVEEPLTAEALCRAIPGLERLDNNLHITNLRDVIYVTVGLVSRQEREERVAWASPSSDSS